jgi:hypothetical protein
MQKSWSESPSREPLAVIRTTSENKGAPGISEDGQFFAKKNGSAEGPRQVVVTPKAVPVSLAPGRPKRNHLGRLR